jgi:tRNA1Val (adenine37-N6)-methyltransferase
MITTETLFYGGLKVLQKEKGYRFSVDAVILAHHIPLKGVQVAVDLGTGCGIIPLIVAQRSPSARIYGIEIQKDLAELAAKNVRLNGMEERITIVHGDMKDFGSFLAPGMADVVFSNPPYGRLLSGRVSPDQERAVAKHEIKACLSDVMSVADKLLKVGGRLCVIYPAHRAIDLLTQMRASKLEPKGLRFVHSMKDSEAELAIAEGLKYGNPGVTVSPPLIVHKKDGTYTDEATDMLKGGA